MSPILTYQQAAHRLRMTPVLLRWFGSHAARRDGIKLEFDDTGSIAEPDLLAFDAHLRGDWGNRYIPKGIDEELRRESAGRCALCPTTTPLDRAHVSRRGRESLHYSQHPHNLILLCKNCHARYDDPNDSGVTHSVVVHWKTALQTDLMKGVDLQIQMATAVEAEMQILRPQLVAQGPQFWTTQIGAQAIMKLVAASGSNTASIATTPGDGVQFLTDLSQNLTQSRPVVAAKLASIADGVGADDDVWSHLDDGAVGPGMCALGDEHALVDEAHCPACGKASYRYYNEVPSSVEENGSSLVAYFEDARGDVDTPACEDCGHSPLEFVFQEFCSYHEHMSSKDWE